MSQPSVHPALPATPLERVVRPVPEIPDHEVVRQIGSGSYGSVWLARALTGAWRAVKVLYRQDFDDERTFNREFEGIQYYEPIARNHPGLVHILHVGRKEGDNPFYYYVMELGDDAHSGVSINPAEYIQRSLDTDRKSAGSRPLPLDYCLEVGSQLAHALMYLHSKGLTHRDIKPSNVIFVNGRPKLADIGLVAHQGRRSFVGTEGFIPPDGPGSPRADVYALSKVLYEITTGRDRLDFPELPDNLPEGVNRKKWQALNNIICAAAEPREEEATIVTAEALAEAIDSIRGFSVHTRFRFPKRKRRLKSSTKLTLSAITGAIVASAVMFWVMPVFRHQPPPVDDVSPPFIPPPDTRQGYVHIISDPLGAAVYDKNGREIGITPLQSFAVEPGEQVKYTLKMPGFADWEQSGIVESGKTLAIGGRLKEYNPPLPGETWKDALGSKYVPEGNTHVALEPLTVDQFKVFLAANPSVGGISHQGMEPSPDSALPPFVLTTRDGVDRYIDWLYAKCEEEGLLGKNFRMIADPVPGFSSGDGLVRAYRLAVARIHQVPVSVLSSPSDADVYLNGKWIGSTPLSEYMVNQEPYAIEVKLPGYAPMRRSGQDPEGLYLSLQLVKDHSVVYHSEWSNSLGMDFIPIGATVMAQTTEVTKGAFNRYLDEAGVTERQPAPGFDQEDNHPVVNVTKRQAEEFARWLTERERDMELIAPGDQYRLPTDEQWSVMAGIPVETGGSPHERSLHPVPESPVYYWGDDWPPANGSGNFADLSALGYLPSDRVIRNYVDSFPRTSPVGVFKAGKTGLFDLEGNVMEWIADPFGGPDDFPFRDNDVARGGNYLSYRQYRPNRPGDLNPFFRTSLPPGSRSHAIGFRLVLIREQPVTEHQQTP